MKEEFQSLVIKQIGLTKTFQDTMSSLLNTYLANKKSDFAISQDYNLIMMPDFKHEFLYLYEQHIQATSAANTQFLNQIYAKVAANVDPSKIQNLKDFDSLLGENLQKNSALIMQRHNLGMLRSQDLQFRGQHGRQVLSQNGSQAQVNSQKREVLKLISDYVMQLSFNQRFFKTDFKIENAALKEKNQLKKMGRIAQLGYKALGSDDLVEQEDPENMQFQQIENNTNVLRNNFLTGSSSQSSTQLSVVKKKRKLRINKIDGTNERLTLKLDNIRLRNKFNKMIMGLEVSIKKEMMHLDAEDSIVSSITGNKVSSPIFNNLRRSLITIKKGLHSIPRTAQALSMQRCLGHTRERRLSTKLLGMLLSSCRSPSKDRNILQGVIIK